MVKRGVSASAFLSLLLLYALFAAASVPGASAADDTLLKDAWYFSGDTFIVDGEVIVPNHLRLEDDRIILFVDDVSHVIDLGSCEATSMKRYCFVEVYRDIANADENSHIKFVGGKFVYAGLRIAVYKRGDVVSVAREISGTIAKGEEVTVTVKIENPTDFSTDSFRYEDIFPEGVVITGGGGNLEKHLHSVIFDENIPPQSEKTLTYRFTVEDYLAFTNHATAEYMLNGKFSQVNTSTISADLTAAVPYTFSASLSPSSIETGGGVSRLAVNVYNKKTELPLTVEEIRVTIPKSDVSFNYEPGTFKKDGQEYVWSGTVNPETSQALEANVRASKSGHYNFTVFIRVRESDLKSYHQSKDLSLDASYSAPQLIFSVKEAVVTEGGLFRAAFSIRNNNQNNGFKQVYAAIRSNFSTEKVGIIDEILPGQTKTLVIKEDIVAPSVEDQTDFILTASGHYRTTYDEEGKFSTEGKVTVKPSNKTISLSQSLDKTEGLRIGDNVTVTVKVSHSTDEDASVDVWDTYSEGLILKGGKASTDLHFTSQGEKQAYIYTLTIPDDYDTPELFVKSEARTRGRVLVISKMQVFPVNLTKPTPPGEAVEGGEAGSDGQGSSGEGAGVAEEEEEGLLTRIVNGITDFFARMLGFD